MFIFLNQELIDIPAPPPVPTSSLETLSDVVTSSNLAEPAFADIGLAGISPSGLIQSILEWLHIGIDLPWWGCIAIGKFHLHW